MESQCFPALPQKKESRAWSGRIIRTIVPSTYKTAFFVSPLDKTNSELNLGNSSFVGSLIHSFAVSQIESATS